MNTEDSGSCIDILEFDLKMQSLRYHLTALLNDWQLIDKGWELYYLCDSYDVVNYTFLKSILVEKELHRGLNWRTAKADLLKAIGQEVFFYDYANLVKSQKIVMPSIYRNEIDTFLARDNVIDYVIQSLCIKQIVKREHGDLAELLYFKDECNQLQQTESGKKELLFKVKAILAERFDDLLCLKFDQIVEGKAKTAAIMKTNGLIDEMPMVLSAEMISDIENIDTSSRYGSLNAGFARIRNMGTPDQNDAKVIATVERLNETLHKEGKLILLFSGAQSTPRILNWDLLEWAPPRIDLNIHEPLKKGVVPSEYLRGSGITSEYRYLRTPRTYRYYLACMESSFELTRAAVNAKLSVIREYFVIAAGQIAEHRQLVKQQCKAFRPNTGRVNALLTEKCKYCSLQKKIPALSGLIETHQNKIREFDNIALYMNKIKNLRILNIRKVEDLKIEIDEALDKSVSNLINVIEGNRHELNTMLNEERAKAANAITSLIYDVRNVAIREFGDIVYKAQVFVNLANRMYFTHPLISTMLTEFDEYIKDSNNTDHDVRNRFITFLELFNSDDIDRTEMNLLLAIISYSWKQEQYCKEVIHEENIDLDPNDIRVSLLNIYLLSDDAISLSEGQLADTVLRISNQLTISHTEDARAHFIHAYSILKLKKAGFNIKYKYTDIRDSSLTALKKISNNNLRLSCLNNLGFAICLFERESSEDKDLSSLVQRILNEMEPQINDCWFMYQDTFGYLYYFMTRFTKDLEKRKEYLEIALRYIQSALFRGKQISASEDEIREIERHEMIVSMSLKELV